MKRSSLSLLAAPCLLAATVNAAEIAAIEKSVVRVLTVGTEQIETGSGLVIAAGLVLTNHHVVRGGRVFFAVSRHTVDKKPARLIWQSPELDLAVLAVEALALPQVTIAARPPGKGAAVWALGYPGASDYGTVNLDATVNRGVISLFHHAPWVNTDSARAVRIIQHDAAINRGNSGGPLFDDCGRVIGVNTQKEADADGVFLALRIDEALPELKAAGIELKVTDAPCVVASAATDAAARDDARQAMQQAQRAQDEALTAAERANQAQQQARSAQQAASEVSRLLRDTREAVGHARQRNRWVNSMLAAVAILAVVLALRRPRERLVNIVTRVPYVFGRQSRRRAATPTTAFVLTAAGEGRTSWRRQLPWPMLAPGQGGFTIGAAAELVDWLVDDASLSPRHARMYERDRRLEVEDLNTQQGTYVNGRRIPVFTPWPLRAGDRLRLGSVDFAVGLNR